MFPDTREFSSDGGSVGREAYRLHNDRVCRVSDRADPCYALPMLTAEERQRAIADRLTEIIHEPNFQFTPKGIADAIDRAVLDVVYAECYRDTYNQDLARYDAMFKAYVRSPDAV